MQRIERYGVIALVVLLVTILAVSLWGEGWNWKPWEKNAKAEVASADTTRPRRGPRQNAQPNAQTPGSLPMQNPTPSPNAPFLRQDEVAGNAVPPTTEGTGAPVQPTNTLAGGAMPNPQTVALNPGLQPQLNAPIQQPNQPLNAAQNQPNPQHPVMRGVEPVQRQTARQYVVRSGDTLGSIAARELGESSRWTEIQALNGNLDPKKVRAGMNLTLPGSKQVASNSASKTSPRNEPKNDAKSNSSSQKRYTVKSGDTLSSIAARELGDGDRWNQIAALNPGIDANKLRVGATLLLPTSSVAKVADDERSEKIGWSPRSGKKTAVQ